MSELLTVFGNAFAASAALAIPAALAWGFLSVVLSPCHLSSVPLVIAYMNGGSESPTGARALGLSSAFAAGILASIALIGGITAAAGRMLGDVGRTGTWVLAGVFAVFGLNLLGILPLPTFAAPYGGTSRRGAPGALLLGAAFGAALGPCTFAFMAPLLAIAWRASATEAGHGALLVATFGLGHALAIVLAGSSIQGVQHWLGSRWGSRAVAMLRTGAGLAVLAGGAYFVVW